jgi:hypothetical protein
LTASTAFVALATAEFSRGFQATVGLNRVGVALATLELKGQTGSIVANATTIFELLPWLESHG